MKKSFVVVTILFVLVLFIIIMNFHYLNPYNTELFHPVFGALLPLTVLMFLCIFLKNINPKSVFLALLILGVIDFIILSAIQPICSGIVCYDRTQMALIISSLFSVIYFIVLLFKNKKKSTLV